MSRWTLVAALILGLAERRAFALCPNCLAQKSVWDAQSGVLAVFLVVPFVAAYVAWRVIAASLEPRRAPGTPQGEASSEARNAVAPGVSRKSASERT